jgi:hypothetical protein
MKYLSLAIIALSLTLGACAHHDNASASSTTSASSSTGYSK